MFIHLVILLSETSKINIGGIDPICCNLIIEKSKYRLKTDV